jgi:hypothetical protein
MCVVAGINYYAREDWNQLQEVEYCTSEINKEEYHRSWWHEADFQPEGGHEFEPKLEGAGYTYCG